ncbi:MAG: precorrin-8X methylmutase [Clostridia bacterium]|nr:precorrin-8X methylmutase [Clostridia bacterium]
MEIIKDPKLIESTSMDIIDQLLPELKTLPVAESKIIKRVVHTAGDPDYAKLVRISPGAIEGGIQAIKGGKTIICDVNMLKAGINKNKVHEFGGRVECYISDEDVAAEAKKSGLTRAIIALRKALPQLQGGIVAIGNAPTALFELCDLITHQGLKPALVVGTPVGFVGARESKELLQEMDIPYITVVGNKGGSTIAASICNALLYMA